MTTLFEDRERAAEYGFAHGEELRFLAHRAGIEALLGEKVHLALHVAVERDWQRDPKKLDRLGF